MRRFALLVVGLAWLAGLSGCETTTVTTVWKNPAPQPIPTFKKVVTFALNTTPAERRAAEDEMARQMHKAQGIPAYTFIPDDALKDREKVKAMLKSNGIDGAVVLRLVSSDKTTTYVPPTYVSRGYGMYDSRYEYGSIYRGGYTETDILIRAEVSVYSVEEGQLLWAGTSDTSNPDNVHDLVVQVAKAVREELRKQGMTP